MAEKQSKRERQLARREQQAAARQNEAGYRQGELLPPTQVIEVQELASSFSGPLPPPDLLLEYDRVLPGLADRIVAMAEMEGRERRALQRRIVRLSELGLIAAIIITLAILWIAWDLIDSGATAEGFGSILLAIGSLLWVFTKGRRGPPEPREKPEE